MVVPLAVDIAITGWFTSAIISKLIDKGLSYYKGQKSWQSGMRDELERLSLCRIQIMTLVYAAERGDRNVTDNPALVEWLGKLRDAVEEADNVLDELEYQRLKEEAVAGEETVMKLPKKIGKFAVRAAQQDDLLKRLRDVIKTFDNLVAGLGILAQVLSALNGRTKIELREHKGRETASLSEDELIGRDNEKQMIVDWLKSSKTKKISVFSLIGVGGVGKTALAQHLFDHQELEGYSKIWACVSNTFDKKVITQNMLESLLKNKQEFDTLDAAQRTLKDNLLGKKFFLVLDDVWNDSEGEWKKLMAPLRYGSEGSKILLTTRMESVANIISKVVGESTMLELNGLEEGENLKLFEKYAFAGVDDPNDFVRLRSIGKEIVKKLWGIPLSAKIIGGMLNNPTLDNPTEDEYYWLKVLEHGALDSYKETDNLLPVLQLSYDHLSTELKPCFRYCSIFPQGHEFSRDQMVHAWISVGLIPGDEKRQEDLASEFFRTLVRKSFFNPKASYYIMHDLLHELAQNLSKTECLRVVSNNPNEIEIPPTIRHLSLRTSDMLVLDKLPQLKYLRTLLLVCDIKDAELGGVLDSALKGLKTLRCLEISSKWLRDFPTSIGDLIHLRYLCITRTSIPNLSPCVCKLYYLQILEFTFNSNFDHSTRSIPTDIGNLSKLKRLQLPSNDISNIPYMGKLTSLQQLNRYRVSGEAGYGISEMEMMSELRELTISNLEHVRSTDEASKAQLSLKQHLRCIALMWGEFGNIEGTNELDKEVANCLKPHVNLTSLILSGYRATNPPDWFKHRILPNLTTIHMAHCSSLRVLPPFGVLPFLKFLILEKIGVSEIGLEFYGSSRFGDSFPALEKLELMRLFQLEEWREDIQSEKWFPRLKRLVILECPCLKKLPPIPPNLKELELNSLNIVAFPGFKQHIEGNNTNQGQWPLSSLLIIGCSKLTSLCSGFFLHPEQLASLEELAIWSCAELVKLPSNGFRELVSLKSLRIDGCSRLFLLPMLLPKNFFPPSVQQLMLSSCGDVVASLPHLLSSLSSVTLLKLEQCDNLVSLPSANALEGLKSLKDLEIRNCRRLKSLGGLEAILSLRNMMIRSCPMLAIEPLSNSTEVFQENKISLALDKLDIDHPGLLNIVPLRNLHLTKSLEIRGSHSMTELPEDHYLILWLLRNSVSLDSLLLSGLTIELVESLPGNLKSLQELRILVLYNAFKLLSLPELPRSLEILEIYWCSEELAARLMEGGQDYDKVWDIDVAVSGVMSQSTIARLLG